MWHYPIIHFGYLGRKFSCLFVFFVCFFIVIYLLYVAYFYTKCFIYQHTHQHCQLFKLKQFESHATGYNIHNIESIQRQEVLDDVYVQITELNTKPTKTKTSSRPSYKVTVNYIMFLRYLQQTGKPSLYLVDTQSW